MIAKILHYWGKKRKWEKVEVVTCELLSHDSVRTSLLWRDKAHMPKLPLFALVIRGGTTWVVQLIHNTWPECRNNCTTLQHSCYTSSAEMQDPASQSTVARSIRGGRGSITRFTYFLVLWTGYYIDTWALYCMIGHYPGSLVPRPRHSDAAAAAARGGGVGQRESTYCLSHQNYRLVLKLSNLVRYIYLYC